MAGVGLRLLICSAASGSRWVSSRGTVNCIFLGLPVSMVALSIREDERRKRRMKEKENPYERRMAKSSVKVAEKENKCVPAE